MSFLRCACISHAHQKCASTSLRNERNVFDYGMICLINLVVFFLCDLWLNRSVSYADWHIVLVEKSPPKMLFRFFRECNLVFVSLSFLFFVRFKNSLLNNWIEFWCAYFYGLYVSVCVHVKFLFMFYSFSAALLELFWIIGVFGVCVYVLRFTTRQLIDWRSFFLSLSIWFHWL